MIPRRNEGRFIVKLQNRPVPSLPPAPERVWPGFGSHARLPFLISLKATSGSPGSAWGQTPNALVTESGSMAVSELAILGLLHALDKEKIGQLTAVGIGVGLSIGGHAHAVD